MMCARWTPDHSNLQGFGNDEDDDKYDDDDNI